MTLTLLHIDPVSPACCLVSTLLIKFWNLRGELNILCMTDWQRLKPTCLLCRTENRVILLFASFCVTSKQNSEALCFFREIYSHGSGSRSESWSRGLGWIFFSTAGDKWVIFHLPLLATHVENVKILNRLILCCFTCKIMNRLSFLEDVPGWLSTFSFVCDFLSVEPMSVGTTIQDPFQIRSSAWLLELHPGFHSELVLPNTHIDHGSLVSRLSLLIHQQGTGS